jgi:hypothetical protein
MPQSKQGRDIQVGSFGNSPGKAAAKEQAVIATLPRHVKSWLMMLVGSNSICWLAFIFGWLGFGDGVSALVNALSGIAVFWSVICLPLQMSFIIKIDWGQRGG